jgi:hypothetical protein
MAMKHDSLEQLAVAEIPPVPADFDGNLHRRVNHALTLGQAAEFALHVLPYAVVHLAQALCGWAALTLSGKYPDDSPVQDH